MTIEKVRSMLKSEPFRPFKLVLIDGRQFPVTHPEWLVAAPGDRTVIHFSPGETDSYFTMIDLLHVATLEPLNGEGRAGSKRRRGKSR